MKGIASLKGVAIWQGSRTYSGKGAVIIVDIVAAAAGTLGLTALSALKPSVTLVKFFPQIDMP